MKSINNSYLDNFISRGYKSKKHAEDYEIEELKYHVSNERQGIKEEINDGTKVIIRTAFIQMNNKLIYPMELAEYYGMFVKDFLDILRGNIFSDIIIDLV